MTEKALQVTDVTTTVSREAGGLFSSVRYMTHEMHKYGIAIEIVGLKDAHTDPDADKWAPLPVHTFDILGPKRFAYSSGLYNYLMASETDLMHLHGLWQFTAVAVHRWARRTGKPYIVSPHGMLEPWALKHSRLRKVVAGWLFQQRCLVEAGCLRATSEMEVESIRRFGLKNPVAMIANGVPLLSEIPELRSAIPGRRRRALFLSRIHPKKGLLNLVYAWASLRKSKKNITENWELVIIGPDEGGHLAEVMSAVRTEGLQDQVTYGGECWDDEGKILCYAKADLFVLPSYSENFGLVIAEALGCGVPVITTRETPWEDLATYRCGWWIETGKEALEHALSEAMTIPLEQLQMMGRRGWELIKAHYSWERPGRQLAEVKAWLTKRGPKPDFVHD